MTPDFTLAKLESCILHYTGQKFSGDAMISCDSPLPVDHEEFADFIAYLFQKNCKEPEKYQLSDAGKTNWETALNEYSNSKDIIPISVHCLKRLNALSISPSILPGELLVAHFSNIEIDGEAHEALGFIKSDSHQSFLKCKYKKSDIDLSLESGLMAENIEKSALFILDTEEPFVYVKDKELKNHKQAWWGMDLFGLTPKSDKLAFTNSVMQVAKTFVAKEIDQIVQDISKPEKVELLTKSADYFKAHEVFDEKQFVQSVFEDKPDLAEGFSRFKENTFNDWNIENKTKFELEETAQKKNQKLFKNILKLDKNFHIYIHGNRELIEKGFDEDKGKHYYKVFFDSEQ